MLLTITVSVFAGNKTLRYRGQYTLGHEVNTFCPAINSQCYWLSPDTNPQIRLQLKQLIAYNTNKIYQAICLVVEGKINRDSEVKSSIGFATDYDGIIQN